MGRPYKKLPAHFKLADLDPVLVIPATFAGSQGRVKYVPAWLPGLRLPDCRIVVTDLVERREWRFRHAPLRPLNVLTVLEVNGDELVGIDGSFSIVKTALENCLLPIWTGASYHAGNLDAICAWITEAAWGARPQRNCTVVDTDNGPLVVGPPYRTLVTTNEALSGIGLADAAKKALHVVSGTCLDMSSVESALTSFIWSVMAGTARTWMPDWTVKSGQSEVEQAFVESRRRMWRWVPGRIIGPALNATLWRKPLQWWHVGTKRIQDDKIREVRLSLLRERKRKAQRAAQRLSQLEVIAKAGYGEVPVKWRPTMKHTGKKRPTAKEKKWKR